MRSAHFVFDVLASIIRGFAFANDQVNLIGFYPVKIVCVTNSKPYFPVI